MESSATTADRGDTGRHQWGTRRQPRWNRHARGPALLVATIVAALALLTPMTPAAADPVPSFVSVSTFNAAPQSTGLESTVSVNNSGPLATGVVVLTEGATEYARATLVGATAHFVVPASIGRHTLTVTYLGSTDVQGSASQRTIDITPNVTPYPLTGTITTHGGTAPIPDEHTRRRQRAPLRPLDRLHHGGWRVPAIHGLGLISPATGR